MIDLENAIQILRNMETGIVERIAVNTVLVALRASESQPDAFQSRVSEWMLACFGAEITTDRTERCHRFLEEALELVQALGSTSSEAHQLVDYVFGRPAGELRQEVGGVMVTLAALCGAAGIDMSEEGEAELARIWTKIEKIRAKHAAKPKHSPLPESTHPDAVTKLKEDMLVKTGNEWRLVPNVPTQAMLNKIVGFVPFQSKATAKKIYKMLLDASPSPPSEPTA